MKLWLIMAFWATAVVAGPVTLKVELAGERDSEMKGKPSKTKIPERVTTLTKQLEITLNNSSAQTFANLNVVYYIFAKDVKDKEIVLSKKGEKTLTLKPFSREMFTSESAVIVHHSRSAASKAGKMETKPESGAKLAGYGAQVFSGNEVVIECFEPKELRSETGLTETSTLYPDEKGKKKKN